MKNYCSLNKCFFFTPLRIHYCHYPEIAIDVELTIIHLVLYYNSFQLFAKSIAYRVIVIKTTVAVVNLQISRIAGYRSNYKPMGG